MSELGASEQEIWTLLDSVTDPEIPVVSLVEMGIVRDVILVEREVEVSITPTFSGCPALHVMVDDIQEILTENGYKPSVKIVHHPQWTSDWITGAARQKLKEFGLAPPPVHGGKIEVTFYEPASCPYCDSTNTIVRNNFGPTLCRAIYYCSDCQQPFEQFKPL